MIAITIVFFIAFLQVMIWVAIRRPVILVASFFLLFPVLYRTFDIVYLDLVGPSYAGELGRYIGGNEAAPMFMYSVFSLVFPLMWVFRSSAMAKLGAMRRQSWGGYHRTITNVMFIVSCLLVSGLYLNMAARGVIPLFAGMDRTEYNNIAGPFHTTAYELNFLLNFALGAFTVLPRLNGRNEDIRFPAVAVALLLYWVLAGNRFSVFFVQLSFFFMPFAAVMIARSQGMIPASTNSLLRRILTSRVARTMAGVAVVIGIGGLLLNSYYNVRGYRDPLHEIQERVLVQPVELWAATWDEVNFQDFYIGFDPTAYDQIFVNPIDPARNTTMQYLMTRELGYFRSAELLRLGQQYTGGYPEVHFELFSPWIALITMPLLGLITALLVRLCISMLLRNMVVSSILATYVYFGFSLHYAGGFITFFLATSYWIKIAALFIAIAAELEFTRHRTTFNFPRPTGRRVGTLPPPRAKGLE